MLQIKRLLSTGMALGLGLALIGCGPKSPQAATEATPATPAASAAAAAPAGAAKKAVITLANGGRIEMDLFPDVAPLTVANFAKLAGSGFYNNLTFHRVEPGFVVQGGDPNGNGTGGPGWTVKAEFSNKPHIRGTLAMARAQDPDSAGSQFYICLAPAPFLDGKYTVFGQVTKGMELVDQIKVGDKMSKVEIVP
jgi:cyclophilin family peptidyl-prolyl cis-trans isomerase